MLIKYCISDSAVPDITEISDVTKEDGNAVFTPIAEDILAVIVKNISDQEYGRVVDMLFDHGKADITYLKEKTFFDEEEIDNNFPLGNEEDKHYEPKFDQ